MLMVSSQDKVLLRPWNFKSIRGKLFYCEGDQAWNVLRLKKEILTEFPQLKEKRSQLFYNVDLFKDYEGLLSLIKKMKKEGKPIPLLLWFYKLDN